MENKVQLPTEVAQIAENVSVEKRNEVQLVLNSVFNGVSKMREQLDSVVVSDVDDKVNMKLANTIRLGVRQVRLEAEKTFDAKRSEVQQQMLSYKTEDSLWLKAKQTMQILTKEIEENARWKEETKARFEAEQKELNVQQRIIKVQKVNDTLSRSDFETMSDEAFDIFYNGLEKAYNDKIEAEQKAEVEQIAKERALEEAREKQRLENERLKAEADKREAEIKKEREESERKLAEAKAEREKAEAERKRVEAENNVKLEAERKERERVESELKAKQEAELKAEREKAEALALQLKEAEKLAKAPIKKQLTLWVESFELTKTDIETEISIDIQRKFESFKQWAKSEIEKL